VEREQLDRVIRKLKRLGPKGQPDLKAVLGELAKSLQSEPAPDRIATRTGGRIQFVDLCRITHFFARDKLTYAGRGREELLRGPQRARAEAGLEEISADPPLDAGEYRLGAGGGLLGF
jgi:hypothetical protein